ncbi:hypothetical protein ACW0US_17570 [Xanthomonas euvesicatoria]
MLPQFDWKQFTFLDHLEGTIALGIVIGVMLMLCMGLILVFDSLLDVLWRAYFTESAPDEERTESRSR